MEHQGIVRACNPGALNELAVRFGWIPKRKPNLNVTEAKFGREVGLNGVIIRDGTRMTVQKFRQLRKTTAMECLEEWEEMATEIGFEGTWTCQYDVAIPVANVRDPVWNGEEWIPCRNVYINGFCRVDVSFSSLTGKWKVVKYLSNTERYVPFKGHLDFKDEILAMADLKWITSCSSCTTAKEMLNRFNTEERWKQR